MSTRIINSQNHLPMFLSFPPRVIYIAHKVQLNLKHYLPSFHVHSNHKFPKPRIHHISTLLPSSSPTFDQTFPSSSLYADTRTPFVGSCPRGFQTRDEETCCFSTGNIPVSDRSSSTAHGTLNRGRCMRGQPSPSPTRLNQPQRYLLPGAPGSSSRQRSSNDEHEHWVASTPRLPRPCAPPYEVARVATPLDTRTNTDNPFPSPIVVGLGFDWDCVPRVSWASTREIVFQPLWKYILPLDAPASKWRRGGT